MFFSKLSYDILMRIIYENAFIIWRNVLKKSFFENSCILFYEYAFTRKANKLI